MTAEQERAAVVAYIARIFATPDSNTDRFLDERLCCNGVHCGCHGSTVGEYLSYQICAAIERGEHHKEAGHEG